MKLAIDSDTNGLNLKKDICVFLKGKGIDFTDLSLLDNNSELDYPDVAFNLVFQIKNKKYERGILICGTGQGMAICANKVQEVYAGACSDEYSAERLRKSNNAQIIILGAYVDGATSPTIQGTGTEDYILHAWGMNSETTYPYCGVPHLEGEWGMVGWWITYYRWHILDPIRFTKSLKVTIEDVGWMSEDETAEGVHRGNVDRNDDFASVAFWYQIGQPKRFTTLPSAKERELPNLDIIIEGKTLMPTVQHSEGAVSLQSGYNWTGDGQLLFIPEKNKENGAYLSCQFNVEKKDMRQATLRLTRSFDFGAYRILLDGKEVREIFNFYSPSTNVDEISLGLYEFEPGLHTLRFEYVGKAGLSLGSSLGIDSFRLRERTGQKRHTPKNFPLK